MRCDKIKAKTNIIEYLKAHNIKYELISDVDNKLVDIDFSDTLYIYTPNVSKVIGGAIETLVRFQEENLYCLSYYCQPIVSVKNEQEIFRAARIIGYINRYLNYDCDAVYEHIFGFDEATGDISNSFLVRYELLNHKDFFVDTMYHILNYSTKQLEDVCIPVLSYIKGYINFHVATAVGIQHNIMGKPIASAEKDYSNYSENNISMEIVINSPELAAFKIEKLRERNIPELSNYYVYDDNPLTNKFETLHVCFENENYSYDVLSLLDGYWGGYNRMPNAITLKEKAQSWYKSYDAEVTKISKDTITFRCRILKDIEASNLLKEIKGLNAEIIDCKSKAKDNQKKKYLMEKETFTLWWD